jgi:hypothetical protein
MTLSGYGSKKRGNDKAVDAQAAVPRGSDEAVEQVPLDPCTHPHTAEAARAAINEDACDDGVK